MQKLETRFDKNPADEASFVKLWDTYLESENWNGIVDLLSTRIGVLDDPSDKVRMFAKLASVRDEKLGDVHGAIDAYHRVLELEPDNRPALRALGQLYHALEDWEQLIEIYLHRIELAESLEEKLSLRSQLATMYEQRLQQEGQALLEHIQAARPAPQNARVLLNMDKRVTRTESFRELMAVYEDVVERIDRIELRVALYLKLGHLTTCHLQDEATAIGYYRRALELAADRTDVLLCLSNIQGDQGCNELIATYTHLIRHAESPELKSRLRCEVARLYREGLDDPNSAFYELVRVARYDPDLDGLVDQLIELGVASDRHLELATVLEDIGARLADGGARVRLYTRLAQLHLRDLHNAHQARRVIDRALEIDPTHMPAQGLRFDLLEASREFEALAQALESFLSRPNLPEAVGREQRKRLAGLYEEKLGDWDRAVELLSENLHELPDADAQGGGAEIREQLHRRQVACNELLSLLRRRAEDTADADGLAEVVLQMAAVYERQLGQPEQAFCTLLKAATRTACHERFLDELFRLGREAGSAAELQTAVDELLGPLDRSAAAGLLTRLALVYESEGKPDEAGEQYQRALELDSTQPVAYHKLRARAENHFQWNRVVELDLIRAAHIDNLSEKVELLLFAAKVLEERIRDKARAAKVYGRILDLQPDADEARDRLGRLQVEVDLPAPEAAPPASGTTVGDAAGSRAAVSSDGEDRATTAEPSADPSLGPADEGELDEAPGPGDVARTDDGRTQPDARMDALTRLWQAVRARPEDVEGWERLSARLAEERSTEQALEALAEGVRHTAQDEYRARLYRRMSRLAHGSGMHLKLARLLEEDGRQDDAESYYLTVLRSKPADSEALDGLLRIYESRDALDRYDAILTRAFNRVLDPAGRRTLLLRRAGLRFLRLSRPEDALADLRQLLEADDSDLDALTLQEEILEASGRHEDLVRCYQHHLVHCPTAEERLRLLVATAKLHEIQLDDAEQAIHFYRRALEEKPSHVFALESLVALLEKRRNWLGAIEQLNTALEAIADPATVNRLHFCIGKILEEQLLRPEEAQRAYRRAIDGAWPSIDALRALKGMARRRGDWVEVIRLGNQLQQAPGQSDEERAGQLIELARVWRDRLDNEDEALACYEQALAVDPDSLEAARVVAESKLKKHRHAEAHKLLARLAERASDEEMSVEDMAALQLRLAQTAEAIERDDQALAAYERALELVPTDPQLLTQYGYFLFRHQRWQKASELYADILEQHGERMGDEDVADVRCLVAQAYDKLGRREEAVEQYRLALQANPSHQGALRASVELTSQLGRAADCVQLLLRLRELSPAPASRRKLSARIGDVLFERLSDPAGAARAYRDGLELEPDNLELLEKLRRALIRSEAYGQAVDVLQKLADLADSDRSRARYLRIAGDIERERLDDEQRALPFYLKALDADPLDRRAQGAAVKVLHRLRDWPRLAELYEDLLRRLPPPIPGQEDHHLSILCKRVELYRYQLADNRKAIEAGEQLLAIDPSQLKVREDLARLYELEEMPDKAIRAHRELIANSPFSIASYHALRRIYESRGEADPALCISATLAFLGEADRDELKLLEEHRHALPMPPGRQLSEAQYNQLLLHPQAAGLLGNMLSFAADFARVLFVLPHRDYRLKARDQLDPEHSDSRVSVAFCDALEFFDLPPPEVYGKRMQVKGIMAVNTSPVSILYSKDAVGRASEPELRFMMARALTFTRPENLLAATLTARQLRTLLEALVELVLPGGPIHPVTEEVTTLAQKLRRVVPESKDERLLHLATQYRERGEDLSIRSWLEGVEHTCNRAGLTLCGDLEAAVRVLKAARVVSPSGSNRTLIRELIFYSISEAYFDLRRALGGAI